MTSRFLWPVCEVVPFKADPADFHLAHVLFCEIAGVLRFERSHLRHLLARILPFETGKLRTRIVRTFGIEHRLPESFEARVTFSMKYKRSRGEIRQQAEFIALRKNYFAGTCFLRQDFPIRFLWIVNRRPPVGGIMRIASDLLRSDDGKKSHGNEYCEQSFERLRLHTSYWVVLFTPGF